MFFSLFFIGIMPKSDQTIFCSPPWPNGQQSACGTHKLSAPKREMFKTIQSPCRAGTPMSGSVCVCARAHKMAQMFPRFVLCAVAVPKNGKKKLARKNWQNLRDTVNFNCGPRIVYVSPHKMRMRHTHTK